MSSDVEMVQATPLPPRNLEVGTPQNITPFSRAAAAGRLRSGVWQMVLSQVVSSVTPLLLVSLYLRAWGPTTYGRWLSLTALVSYLSLLDFGGQTFIGNLAAMDFAKGDSQGMRAKLSEGLSLFFAIALAAYAVIGTVLFLPRTAFLGRINDLQGNDRAILLLMAGAFLLAIPGSIYAVAYRSSGLVSRGIAIGTYSRLVAYASFAVSLLIGIGPVAYAGLNAATAVMGTVVVVRDAPRHIAACRGLRIRWSLARAGVSQLAGALFFWLLSVANAVNQQGIILVLAALSGPTAVVTFVTHRMVANAVLYVANIFQGPTCPEMTFLHARENTAGLARLLKVTLKTVVLISAVLGMFLWFVAPVAYQTWTRHRVAFDPLLLAILLAQVVLASAWTTSGWSLIAVNHHKGLAYWNAGNAALTIVLAILFVPHYGVYGAAVASLLGDIVCGLLVYPALAARLSRCSPVDIYRAAGTPLLVVCGIGIPLIMVRRYLGVWEFGLVTALSVAAVLLLCIRFVFNQEERRWIRFEIQTLCGI
jgi:O-antigen/teichoic acid export membrane protein